MSDERRTETLLNNPKGPRPKKRRSSRTGRLLVVDDNEMNRDMLSRRLGRKGFAVDVAIDGHDALKKIAAEDFDLVLLDIMMPGISGLDVLQEVRQSKSVADLPVIMATAKTESADVVRALRLGANDYVTKPLDFPVVLARVEAQLGLKQANEEIKRLASQVEQRNQFIREVFGRYLSDDIVTTLLETPEGLSLGGDKREITILMCDIRGFSVLSASLEPAQVLALVNNFLSVMTEVILEHGGTIDEIIGDAILVLFGAPVEQSDHAAKAVSCALSMQLAMDKVNALNREMGVPEVEMGIGINTGEVVVGNIGSDRRTKYGVVGANVNLTARIEGYSLGGQVLVSERTRDQIGERLETAKQLSVNPKGFTGSIVLHDVTGLRGDPALALPAREQALVVPVRPVNARVTVMQGKDASGAAQDARVLRMSDSGLGLETDAPFLEALDNVALQISAEDTAGDSGEIFAKVTSVAGNEAELQITSLPGDGSRFIRGLLP